MTNTGILWYILWYISLHICGLYPKILQYIQIVVAKGNSRRLVAVAWDKVVVNKLLVPKIFNFSSIGKQNNGVERFSLISVITNLFKLVQVKKQQGRVSKHREPDLP